MKKFAYEQWTVCDCGDDNDGPHYKEHGGLKFWAADNLARYKRLTMAECVAEYWRAMYDLIARKNVDGKWSEDALRWAETTERFALHPHVFGGE